MTYRVEPTAQAEADINRIYDSLAERSPEWAARWYESFRDAVERLRTNPFSCGLAYENADFDEELRHLLFRTPRGKAYRALFVVRGDTVKILAVCWPGQRPIRPEDRTPEG